MCKELDFSFKPNEKGEPINVNELCVDSAMKNCLYITC